MASRSPLVMMVGPVAVTLYVCCLLGSVTSQPGAPVQRNVCSMTPRNLQESFISNCAVESIDSDVCMTAWTAFSRAFSSRNPDDVTSSDYSDYFDAIPIQAMINQSLFWSGTLSLVEIVSMMNAMGVNVVSSANVPSSEIINNIPPSVGNRLSWCGNESGGIDFTNNCTCNVTTQFWVEFSARFSQAARGTVFFLGDGTREGGAFNPQSFFSTVELLNLSQEDVMRVVALIVHPKGVGESCSDSNSSLTDLRARVVGRNFMFDCYDLFGDISQVEQVAGCASEVIGIIQQDAETNVREVSCGTIMLQVSVALVLMMSFITSCVYNNLN